MVSRELMKNKDRLERIEILRNLRRKLNNLNLTNEEKVLLLRSLNQYEDTLILEITIKNNNIQEYGILGDLEFVEIPIDTNKPTYKELDYFDVYNQLEISVSILKDLLDKSQLLDISDDEKIIFFESLKDYLNYLILINKTRENNKNFSI